MTEFSPFSCPFSWGHPKASGFCFQSDRLLYGGEPNAVEGGTGKAEAAKLQDAGISPKQWPKKMSGRKRKTVLDSTESCEERKSHREARNSSQLPCPTHMHRA